MATQKPISTISYNSVAFLKEKLNNLYAAHIICAYQFIEHKGEDGDKDHIHLRIEPNKRIDPMELDGVFCEYIGGENKPRKCMSFRPSKEEDWLLYAVHDPDYMRLKYANDKCEKIPYEWTQIQCSEGYMLEQAFIRAKQSLSNGAPSVVKALEQGRSSVDLISEGFNPFLVNGVSKALTDWKLPRVMQENEELRDKIRSLKQNLDELTEAVERLNYAVIVDRHGHIYLEKVDENPFLTDSD